jgi:hypothetical protein
MPKGPKAKSADFSARVVMITKIATSEIKDVQPAPESDCENPVAVALGHMGRRSAGVERAVGR